MIFGRESGSEQHTLYQKTYEPNEWEKHPELRLPQISIEKVLGTHALFMDIIESRPRTVRIGDRKYGFAALNSIHSGEDEFYDDSVEEYLSGRVAEVADDQWSMRIRFRQNVLSEKTRNESSIDDFGFSWIANGNVQAWYGRLAVLSAKEGTHEDWHRI